MIFSDAGTVALAFPTGALRPVVRAFAFTFGFLAFGAFLASFRSGATASSSWALRLVPLLTFGILVFVDTSPARNVQYWIVL